MDKVTFALPTLATAEMSRQDQIDLIVNQATAAIVCKYLEHMNAVQDLLPACGPHPAVCGHVLPADAGRIQDAGTVAE